MHYNKSVSERLQASKWMGGEYFVTKCCEFQKLLH